MSGKFQKYSLDEKECFRSLLLPRPIRQLAMEADNFERKIRLNEKDAKIGKAELTMMWMDTVTKKDQIKTNSGISYEPPAEVTRIEKAALVKLFKDLCGYSWSRNFGWIGQGLAKGRLEIDVFEVPSSLYDGVTTERVKEARDNSANVVGIDFSGTGCTGKLPESIVRLEECTFLMMNLNAICGSLPVQLGNLKLLTNLDLSANMISGTLDFESFSQLTVLENLNLSFNSFEGPIPDVFSYMPCLTNLNLAGNRLSEGIPPSLSFLTELQELKLYNNCLSGSIPDCFSQLQNLAKANLSNNKLTGGLNVFNCCSKLRWLDLSGNEIRGRLDMNVLNMKRLEILYLHNNRVSGLIPPELCLLTKLQRINLAHNQIRGVLPHNIGELTNLETLLLTGNSIVGPVPLSLSNLTKLRDFHIFRSYPAEISMGPIAHNQHAFERIYGFGPRVGINSVNWDYNQVYGRERDDTDNESVTIFSGTL